MAGTIWTRVGDGGRYVSTDGYWLIVKLGRAHWELYKQGVLVSSAQTLRDLKRKQAGG